MDTPTRNPSLRQGQFLWMAKPEKENYIGQLKKKITEGFYFSEKVVSTIVDEIAPILDEKAGVKGLS